jgi:hypothetical protein
MEDLAKFDSEIKSPSPEIESVDPKPVTKPKKAVATDKDNL